MTVTGIIIIATKLFREVVRAPYQDQNNYSYCLLKVSCRVRVYKVFSTSTTFATAATTTATAIVADEALSLLPVAVQLSRTVSVAAPAVQMAFNLSTQPDRQPKAARLHARTNSNLSSCMIYKRLLCFLHLFDNRTYYSAQESLATLKR